MMHIGILSRAPRCYSTQSLTRALGARGHQVSIIDPLKCYMSVNANEPHIYYEGKKLPLLDALIPRIGASHTFYGCSVLRQFEAIRTYSINSAIAITRARDKLRSLQLMARKGINMPVSVFAHAGQSVKDLIPLVGGAPLIIKLLEGTQGIGVVLAETRKAAESVIEAFYGLKVNFLIQEYIKEAEGADIRCLVIGGRIVASMQRVACAGEFRANLHRGGRSDTIKITKEERELALFAAKTMGLNMAGVDLIRSERGPMVLEVNSSPGLRGIEETTGVDVAGKIADYISTHCKKPDKHYQG